MLYLESKIYKIKLINTIPNNILKEMLLKTLNEDLLLLEIEDCKYDIDHLTRHFNKYINYNMTECLFKCNHPCVNNDNIKMFIDENNDNKKLTLEYFCVKKILNYKR